MMLKSKFVAGLLSVATVPVLVGCQAEKGKDKPNIIVILADDMGYSDIGCYGGEMKTPNLDRLATQGVRLTQFYNSARCCPTRASLLTGLYSQQTGIGHMTNKVYQGPVYQGFLNQKCVTIAEVLGSAGYSTNMVGKWHVGTEEVAWPSVRGFQRFFGIHNWVDSYLNVLETCEVYEDGKIVIPATKKPRNVQNPNTDWYTTDIFTDKSIEYIDKSIAGEKPFFLYTAFNSPHWPLEAHDSIINKYLDKYNNGWTKLIEEKTKRMKEMGIINRNAVIPDQNMIDWNTLSDSIKSDSKFRRAIYAAQIEIMDYNIGRIINHLKEKGIYDNTVIIFLSDNGCSAEPEDLPFGYMWGKNTRWNYPKWKYNSGRSGASQGMMWAEASNAPFRMYKKFIHEGGIATPLIISYPAKMKNPGRLETTPRHLNDIMATCLDLAGTKYPETFNANNITPSEGLSLAPVISGRELERHEAMFWEHENHAGVRAGNMKLVTLDYNKPDAWELYDLQKDPTEINNLAASMSEKLDSIKTQWNDWAVKVGVNPKVRINQRTP